MLAELVETYGDVRARSSGGGMLYIRLIVPRDDEIEEELQPYLRGTFSTGSTIRHELTTHTLTNIKDIIPELFPHEYPQPLHAKLIIYANFYIIRAYRTLFQHPASKEKALRRAENGLVNAIRLAIYRDAPTIQKILQSELVPYYEEAKSAIEDMFSLSVSDVLWQTQLEDANEPEHVYTLEGIIDTAIRVAKDRGLIEEITPEIEDHFRKAAKKLVDNLPDAIIYHVLNYVFQKEAIR